MKKLDIFKKDGDFYECFYCPETKLLQIIGPLTATNSPGIGKIETLKAESEQKAKEKLFQLGFFK